MVDPLGRICVLTLLAAAAAQDPNAIYRQQNFAGFASPSSLHGIPSEAFRVPFPQMYESYTRENEQSSQNSAPMIPGMSTSTDSSGRVITSLSMGLRRTKEDELNEIKIVPRERMVHALRETRRPPDQEQVVPSMNTLNSAKPRRKPRFEHRRRPTSDELYSDIFPSVIESPESTKMMVPLDAARQFTALRDVQPSSAEQKPSKRINPNSNSLVRVFAAQVPTAQIDPIDITKSMEDISKDIDDDAVEETETEELVAAPPPPMHAMVPDGQSEAAATTSTAAPAAPAATETTPPPTTTTAATTEAVTTTTTMMPVTELPTLPTVPAGSSSGSILPRGHLESIPEALLAEAEGEEGEIVPSSEKIGDEIEGNLAKEEMEIGVEETKEEMKREQMRKMEEEIKENQIKINKKRAAKDEIVEKSGVEPVSITRTNNYRPPPPPVRREVLMEPRCHYDPNVWAMHPRSAVTSATMFARTTGASCEECLKECVMSQKSPWNCRSVTYDAEWKICDLFAISATSNPFHLVEYKGRDYFEYLPAAAPTEMDMKKMDEFSLIQKNEETVTEVKSCEVRLHELEVEIARLKGLARSGTHSYAITTPAPSLPFRASGVNNEEYTAAPIGASDMLSVDGGVAEGSANLNSPASKRTSDAMVMSSTKKELGMETPPMAYRRRVGGKNRGAKRIVTKRVDPTMETPIGRDNDMMTTPHGAETIETHVRMVHSNKNPMEAHKELNPRASAVSTSVGGPVKFGEMSDSGSSAVQLQLEKEDVKNAEHTGRTSSNINGMKSGVKVHKIPPSFAVNSGSSAEGEGYEGKNLVPPSPIEHEVSGVKVPPSFNEDHPEPLSGDVNKLPALIDHPTWAILAASNHEQTTPMGAVVTSSPSSCRGRAHHVFVSFAQTDVIRIGQMKDCPVRSVEECARFCDRESSFECVAFVVDILGCHLLSTRPDHRNNASFMRNAAATYAEKICMGVGRVHLHGILGAAREHLLIGTVTTMASTASLSQCIEECAASPVRRGFRCAAAMWYPRYDAQNCHLSQSARVTRQQGAHLMNSNSIYFEMPPPSVLHRHVMSAIN